MRELFWNNRFLVSRNCIERSSTHTIDYKRMIEKYASFRLQLGDQFVHFLNVIRYFPYKVSNSTAACVINIVS